jgi:hypothetical protein
VPSTACSRVTIRRTGTPGRGRRGQPQSRPELPAAPSSSRPRKKRNRRFGSTVLARILPTTGCWRSPPVVS